MILTIMVVHIMVVDDTMAVQHIAEALQVAHEADFPAEAVASVVAEVPSVVAVHQEGSDL